MDDMTLEEIENEIYTKETRWGVFSTERRPVMWYKQLISWFCIILGFGGCLMLTLMYFPQIEPMILGVGCGGGLGLVGIVLLLFVVKKEEKDYDSFLLEVREEKCEKIRKFRTIHPYYEDELFYIRCYEDGIEEVDSKAGAARIKIYAQNNGIAGNQSQLTERFNRGKMWNQKFKNRERLESALLEDFSFEIDSTWYGFHHGRNKQLWYIVEKIQENKEIVSECEQKLSHVVSDSTATYQSVAMKEHDWAVHGGVASAIAGPAAGVATALDIQMKNQKIRQHNANMMSLVSSLAIMQNDQLNTVLRQAKNELAYWNREMKWAKRMLIDRIEPKKLLNMINPVPLAMERRITGAIRVKIQVDPAEDLYIFGNLKAIVDGSFRVVLKHKGREVGSGIVVLPYGGLRERKVIECIIPKVTCRVSVYEVAFLPRPLWAAESREERKVFNGNKADLVAGQESWMLSVKEPEAWQNSDWDDPYYQDIIEYYSDDEESDEPVSDEADDEAFELEDELREKM